MTRVACAAVVVICLASPPIEAEVRVELILDASDDMSAELANGHTRISAARLAIASWVEEQDADARAGLGLTATGGTPSDDSTGCGHRVLVEPDTADLATWTGALDAVETGGSRALILGVTEAAGRLATAGMPANLIIITSGEEACGGEPDTAADALGGEIGLWVIGLGLGDDQLERFSAVAPTRNASDSQSLLEALRATALDIAAELLVLEAPGEVAAGRRFEVRWSGPSGKADFLCIADPEAEDGRYLNLHLAKEGSPAILPAPIEPGTYEVRYVDGRTGRVLDRTPVVAVAPELVLEAAPTVRVGQRFEVSWSGPNADGDFITIAPEGSGDRRHLDWIYTSLGSPATLAAPLRPGSFEIRYVSGATSEVLAAIPLTVEP